MSPNKIIDLYALKGSTIIRYDSLGHTKCIHDMVPKEAKNMVAFDLS